MKRRKQHLYTILASLVICVCFIVGILFLLKPEVEVSDNQTNQHTQEESETENVFETEQSTEEIIPLPPSKPLSYVEKIELDYVEQPLKREPNEAIAKMYELSRWYPALYFVAKNADQYPEELLLSGAGNPEMADFLYGYMSSDGSAPGGFTDEEQPEDHPLLLQFDPRWGYMQYGSRGTVGSSGCGPTCLSMAVFYLTGDRSCTPDVITQYSLDKGYYVEGVGTAWTLLTDYPAEFGLTSFQIPLREAKLKAELDKGRYLICSVRPGDFTSTGHFILIYGYDENGFKINDPKCVYRSRLSWTYEQIQDDIKATWSVGH
ncbi:MAG: C39 family peptidase [Agathobacter sp.]|nr:C39 family peptidase [Agathobacter sp.]